MKANSFIVKAAVVGLAGAACCSLAACNRSKPVDPEPDKVVSAEELGGTSEETAEASKTDDQGDAVARNVVRVEDDEEDFENSGKHRDENEEDPAVTADEVVDIIEGATDGESSAKVDGEKEYQDGRKAFYGLDGADVDPNAAISSLRSAAEKGYAPAKNLLSYAVFLGCAGQKRDYDDAFKLALELGEEERGFEANAVLARIYTFGYGVAEPDLEKAAQYREAMREALAKGVEEEDESALIYNAKEKLNAPDVDAAEAGEIYDAIKGLADAGCAVAKSVAGCMLTDGLGVEADAEEGYNLVKEAADQKDPRAVTALGADLLFGAAGERDPEKALELFKDGAEQGSFKAQSWLAYCALAGVEGEKDPERAFELVKKSADENDPAAMASLCGFYYYGVGTEADEEKAVECLRKAAELGHEDSVILLAECLEEGNRVEKNEKEAVEWLRRADAAGYSEGTVGLAACYFEGIGVEKDSAKALTLLEGAYNRGHVNAALILAKVFAFGDGVEKDEKKAVEWFRRGAEKGDETCLDVLAACYITGTVVEQDRDKALKLYEDAAENNPYMYARLEYLYGPIDSKKADEMKKLAAEHNVPLAVPAVPPFGMPLLPEGEKYSLADLTPSAPIDPAAPVAITNVVEEPTVVPAEAVPADGDEAVPATPAVAAPGFDTLALDDGRVLVFNVLNDGAIRMGEIMIPTPEPGPAELYDQAQNAKDDGDMDAYADLLMESANGGHVPAMKEAATLCEKDSNRSGRFEWLLKAADAGDGEACFKVGECFRLGDGVGHDSDKWREYRDKANEAGYEPEE